MTEASADREASILDAPLLVQAGVGLALTSLAWDPLLLVGIGAIVVLGIALTRSGSAVRGLAQVGLLVAGAVTLLTAWSWIAPR